MSQGSRLVSIVIPVYNDPFGIEATLDSVLEAIDEHEAAICVVDNNSTDNTPTIAQSYVDNFDNVSLVFERDRQSSYAARNKGISSADGDLLTFLDADMTVPTKWLNAALKYIHTHDADYVGSNVELTPPPQLLLAGRYDRHTGFPVEQYIEHQQFAPTSCLFVRRSIFEDVGLFDHRLISGGDKEFGNRVYEAGYDLHFSKNVTAYHPTRNTLRELVAKDFRVGRGLCQLQRYHPDRYGEPGIPPRPSGVKRPDSDIPTLDRLAIRGLGTFLTGVRGMGYYREYLRSSERDSEGIPTLDD